MAESFVHKTVLKQELVDSLSLKSGDLAIDCTAGGGGHTALMLEKVGSTGHVIAIDQDPIAIKHLEEKFAPFIRTRQLSLVRANFSQIADVISKHQSDHPHPIKGIAADLGVSSPQLDWGERGFSFRLEAPLDMRMDQSGDDQTAADLVNTLSHYELRDIIRDYGEEHFAGLIAAAIIRAREKRPIKTTKDLVEVIQDSVGSKYKKGGIHPATRTFQAFRIAVNRELAVLSDFIKQAPHLLAPGGRIAVISFHSLEDRMVKHQFQELAGKRGGERHALPRDIPLKHDEMMTLDQSFFEIIKPFPILATEDEIRENVRARSAKLRVLSHK